MTTDVPAIAVRDLQHGFRGRNALANVSFDVPSGSLHGFVGPNGAGKTTTLKVIATLLRPQGGTARVFGHDVVTNPGSARKRIGYMPDHFSMYRQMTVHEYLDFFAAAYGQGLRQRDKTIGDVLALTDMDQRRHDLIRGLSRGMQQRVSLARVLVHDPDLLLLDEPASGLDPRARIELMEILRELQRMGKTVFISSHILKELADLCDSVTILDRGTVKYSGAIGDLVSSAAQGEAAWSLVLAEAVPAVAVALTALPGVRRVEPEAEHPQRLTVFTEAGALKGSALLAAVLAAGGEPVEFRPSERGLDQAFMDLTTAGVRT